MKLTAQHYDLMNLVLDPEVRRSQAKYAEMLGVSPRTIFNWLHDEDFLDELERRRRQYRSMILTRAYIKIAEWIEDDDKQAILKVVRDWDDYHPEASDGNAGDDNAELLDAIEGADPGQSDL